MPKLKVLKSIGHNLAHSFLSLMNYIDDDYIIEHIFGIAKSTSKTFITVDVLNQSIQPVEYCTPSIIKSLHYLKSDFLRLLQAEHLSYDHINSAIITIDFDLSKTQLSKNVPSLELAKYDCNVKIVDCNGKCHKASVVEWWKY